MNQEEIWIPIADWENLYEVSNLGRVRSLDSIRDVLYKGQNKTRTIKGRILKPFNSFGYNVYCLHKSKVGKKVKGSRLVLSAFVGPMPTSIDACHNDGNRANDKLTNLRWDTRKGNMADCLKHGTRDAGINSKNSKIDLPDYFEILDMIKEGVSYSIIAGKFGICKQAVCNIKKRKTYIDETELAEQREQLQTV